jgi:hypothetical protein
MQLGRIRGVVVCGRVQARGEIDREQFLFVAEKRTHALAQRTET